MAYFDAAYLVKCYVKEEGWQKVRALAAERGRIASSVIGRLELHAALHRKLREGGLSAESHQLVLRQLSFDEATGVWHWISLSPAVARAVVDLFRQLPSDVYLRTGDAVHLVSAKEQGFAEIFSSDRRLLEAADHVGMAGRDVTRAAPPEW
ncbi:MAG: type II toxin-antitoxin system VapC family toxin [Acidobacteriota bacterium]|nr:type II toxin-antitoxin system VapC family toxin [Acidobacteriota bacterium]